MTDELDLFQRHYSAVHPRSLVRGPIRAHRAATAALRRAAAVPLLDTVAAGLVGLGAATMGRRLSGLLPRPVRLKPAADAILLELRKPDAPGARAHRSAARARVQP